MEEMDAIKGRNKLSSQAKRTIHKNRIVRYTKKGLLYLVLCGLSLIFMLPFLYMFFMSFMTDLESVGNPVAVFVPQGAWQISNYVKALDTSFFTYLKNTMIIIVVNLVVVPLVSSFCAFGFCRCTFKGRDACFSIVLSTMMFPAMAVQIPLYVIYVKLGWINTLYPFIVPAAFGGGAMNIFLIRQFMRSLPSSLDEAATIDGANKFRIYFSIYLPLSYPILIFVMIGVFNGTWNDFMGPLMYLRDPDSYTLALGVFMRYAGRLSADSFPNVQMATGMMMIIPSAIVFFIFQKQMIEGVSVGSVKG